MHHKSAIQGINSGLGMVNVDLLHISNFAQTGNLGIHAVKAAGGLELAQPGICVIASHIVVGMVTGNHHQGAQDNLGVTGFLDLFDHSLAGGVFRLALNSANEHIVIAQGLHGHLHLAVADLCGVGSAVAHEHKSSAIGGSSGGGYTYYTIKATAGVNGSISPTGNVSVREGRDQTFTITPNKGYAVAKVLIDSKNVGAVKSYTFENVKKNHTIEVVFMKASGNPQTGVFVDVPEGSYYEEAVNWAVEKGITTGTDATHFSPDGICTRAQAVTFLWRAAGSPAAKSAVMPFTDVKAGSYYYDAVLWAVENGITKGTSDTMFSPDATCSRAQIVTFLWRSQKSPAAGTANPFTDVKASAYYADAVLWAVKEDVTKGTTNTTFSPDANCTRAQIVTFIWRALAE